MSNKTTPEPAVKVWLTFLCSIKLWNWSLLFRYTWNTNSKSHTAKVNINSLHRIFWVMEYWHMVLKCQIWSAYLKPFFWESKATLKLTQKFFLYIGVSHKFVFNSSKSVNQIFWTNEFWYTAWKHQIFSINTKLFFLENEATLSDEPSPYIWGSYKFILKSGKSLNRIFWAYGILIQGFKMPNLFGEYKAIFLRKQGTYQNSPKLFSLYLSFV